MTVIIFTALLFVAVVLIAALTSRANRSPDTDRLPRKMFATETSEELVPSEDRPRPHTVPVELPDTYNDTRLVLMVRDPEWLFAYWEIADGHWEDLARHYGGALSSDNLTLRIFEMSDEMGYFEINVGGLARDWHIRVGKSQTPFYCQLGIKHHQDFIPLAVSNTVVTPRDDYSHLYDEEWMLVNDNEQRLLKRLGEFPLDLTSPFMFRKDD